MAETSWRLQEGPRELQERSNRFSIVELRLTELDQVLLGALLGLSWSRPGSLSGTLWGCIGGFFGIPWDHLGYLGLCGALCGYHGGSSGAQESSRRDRTYDMVDVRPGKLDEVVLGALLWLSWNRLGQLCRGALSTLSTQHLPVLL